ncbi:MFS transporter [Holophaga foetida]|uniref:MFS transporter n=1 Tax=Holophaga foetida TaxID=35839 RepID=UPI0002474CC1|nr:MFS transporter [Holophaga foetida]
MHKHFKWIVALSLGLVMGINGANLLAFAPILGEIARDLNIGIPLAQGSLLGIFLFVVALSAVAGGVLADRMGIMKTILSASLAGLIPNLLYPIVGHSLIAMIALRVIQGYGAGSVFALMPLVAAHWFEANERGRVVGILTTILAIGMMAGVAGSPGLFQAFHSWRAAMFCFGLAGLVFLVLTLIVSANYKKYEPARIADSATKRQEGGGWQYMKSALHNPTTYMGILMCMFISWLLNALNDLTPQYFALLPPMGVGFGPVRAGQLMLGVQVGSVFGGLVGGFMVDKLFKGNPKPVLFIGFLITAISVYSILFPGIYQSGALLPLLFLAGLAVNFLNPAAATFVAQTYPEAIVGKVAGIWLGLGAFGGGFGVICSALCLHATGTYVLTIRIFALVAFLGLALAMLLRRLSYAPQPETC